LSFAKDPAAPFAQPEKTSAPPNLLMLQLPPPLFYMAGAIFETVAAKSAVKSAATTRSTKCPRVVRLSELCPPAKIFRRQWRW
jgi:hypothetical protein